MEYFVTAASICMVFTMFPFGLFSLDIELAINNAQDSSTDVTCGSKVVFVCSLSTAPTFYVQWLVDGSHVSTCAGTCTPTSGTLSHYTFTQISNKTEYHLTIDPLTFNDSKSFVCQDADRVKSNTIKINVVARYSKDTSTIATAEDNTTVTVVVATNCMSSPMTVVPKLQYKKQGSNNASYLDFPDSTRTVNYQYCTTDDNPYCGGNVTMRGKTTLNIQKSDNGVMYTFLLRVEENGSMLVQQLIGSFGIKDIAVTSNSSAVTVVVLVLVTVVVTVSVIAVAVWIVIPVIVRQPICSNRIDKWCFVCPGKRRHCNRRIITERNDCVRTHDTGHEMVQMKTFRKTKKTH